MSHLSHSQAYFLELIKRGMHLLKDECISTFGCYRMRMCWNVAPNAHMSRLYRRVWKGH